MNAPHPAHITGLSSSSAATELGSRFEANFSVAAESHDVVG
jgi:hypothetical protein